MDVVVCMKQVPDTETKIKLLDGGSGVDFTGVKFIINPYDEFAVEEAIRIKEKRGGKVTLVSMGPQRFEESIRTALAMGVDDAIHIKEENIEAYDSIATAKILAKAIKGLKYDLILVGKQAIDDDSAQLCSILAEYLDLPNVSVVNKIDIAEDGKSAQAKRQVEGGDEEITEFPLPAVISAQKELNVPRYPTLPNIMKVKKKEIKSTTVEALGAADAKPMTKIIERMLPQKKQAGKIIEFETPQEAAQKLVKLLIEEAKINLGGSS